jgi:hypothetical protein
MGDGHMTGLAIIALRKAGLASTDPQLQRGISWLLHNQRQSGRWWTRSLNTDDWHFVTYSGTLYPLLALALCDALPRLAPQQSVFKAHIRTWRRGEFVWVTSCQSTRLSFQMM